MAFGDNSAARARKRELIQEQKDQTIEVVAFDGAPYLVYPDLPPGVGWVIKRKDTYAVAKWYVSTKGEALERVNEHARMVDLGRNADERGNVPKALRRLK